MTIDRSIYRTRFGEEEIGGRVELWQVLCDSWFKQFFPPDATVLDLGAGSCEFINSITAAKKIALDHNPDVRGFAAKDVECIVAELREGLAGIEENTLDRVLASNVFEHLPDKDALFTCLQETYRTLKPGGSIVIMQPNIAAVKERFYDYSDHTLPLTEKGMAEAVRAVGFELERVVARFLPYTTKSRYPAWPILVRLYLRFPIVHRFLGGQMFIVARKP